MAEGSFGDFAADAGFSAPVTKAASHPVWYTIHIVLFAQSAHGGVTDRPPGRRRKDQTNPPDSRCAASRTAKAPVLRGTRCTRPVLVCSAGIVQVAVVRSISVHVACLTSPLLVAVRVRNLKAAIAAQGASVVSTVRMAADLVVGQGFHVLGSLRVGAQGGGDAVVGWVELL